MTQDEAGWVLDTVKTNWPETSFPDDLFRINRDEPKILETGDRSKSIDLGKANALSVSRGSRSRTPAGPEYRHRVETTVSVRLEGVHDDEWGHVNSAEHFEQLVRYVQHALLQERSYPTVPDVGDAVGSVAYHSLFLENEQDLSGNDGDFFRRDWEVRLVGYDDPDTP